MKALLLALFFSCSIVHAQTIKIENPHEFEFIHCVSADSGDDETVMHYILDVRNQAQAKLYWDSAPKKAKAVELANLKLLDDQLVMNPLSDVDLSYVSTKNQLMLALNIIDADGFVLDGELRVTKDKYHIHCTDTSLER